jgi:riboflavin kinase / FMN adenylyltransferase
MQTYDSIDQALAARLRHTVATLGVFDGVHVGHRYVLRECLRLAEERAAPAVVVTFRTHPRAIIAGKAPKLITSIEHRLRLFAQLGFQHCLVLAFDEELRRTPAARFAHTVFEEVLDAQVVVLGHNCRFGRDQEGSADWLIEHQSEFVFEARKARELRLGDENVSSTDIRNAILDGDLERASSMLGRPFSIYGTVVHGDGRGRTIGIPTANLDLHHELRPPRGVYGVRADVGGKRYFGLMNIGVRPTFGGGESWEDRDRADKIEVHLLDFDGDLYGQDLEVMFLKRLRGEKKFASAAELVAQIAADRAEFSRSLEGTGGEKMRRVE